MSRKDWILKIGILGDTSVGKTALVNRFIEDTFKEDYKKTLGVNIMVKTIALKEPALNVRLILWDIAGQEAYRATRSRYFEGMNGALLVYDITRYSSFDNIEAIWLKDYKNFVKKNRTYILIGNKNDLTDERGVETEDGLKMAKKINAVDFIETSAKAGTNVEEAFINLVKQIFKELEEKE